ncbi:hypothetical protein E2R55_05070 [Vibrio vulnificus]|nr:hypothetical protein E2R55_05070 [Vibrio vulnificus]
MHRKLIETTDEHPFWIVGEGWVEAKNLVAGDLVETNDGNTIRIDTIQTIQKQETVYNFKVKDYHSYYVSDLGIWTHNSCNSKKKSIRKKAKDFHGNDHRTTRPAVGYSIRKRDTGQVMKYGETIRFISCFLYRSKNKREHREIKLIESLIKIKSGNYILKLQKRSLNKF